MKKYFMAVLFMATIAITAQDDTIDEPKWSAGRPDGHAPISVMGDHMHGKGEWMFSYRYMYMNMDELKQGSDDASFDDALADYTITPTTMPMNMHMLGAMYAPSDKITLMAMANYLSMEMDHLTQTGGTFTTEASGFGDIQLAILYKFFNKNQQTIHGQLGFSLPTGSITESDVTPASTPNEVELPYPMQLGSGTFDTNLALTYLGQRESFSWGSQLKGVFRFGENDREYRYGNRYSLNNWFAVKASNWLSFSARLEGLIVGEIEGVDPNLMPMMVITADTNNSGGTYINSGIGANTYISKGALKNLRFGVELGYPLYQDLNGIQLKNKETLTLGAQYSF
ncbi:alpha-amylase [Flagellimonas eckloniae]|uniref:Alpha amylase, catalytic subdomain protein n=1 Tax=Flagellimonas eckloniae TaxID=346185 RepID=A0A0Q0XPB5_9FLAO|nr:alpha-amylase [Allomuricauda eckloniae]KQC30903.1 alpha amylase, catalytic subdomain protein [Allomuricauda eckloniae]